MNEAWPKTTLGELEKTGKANIQTGPFGTVFKASEYSENGVPVISVGEIQRGYIKISDHTPKVPESVTSRLPQFILKSGDIVFGRKGAIDRNSIVTDRQSDWFLGSDGIRLRLCDSINSLFVSYQFRIPTIGHWLLKNSSGSIMPSLNQKILNALPLWLPETVKEQKKIAAVLSALDAKIEINNRINGELEAMAKTLYDYWFVQFDFSNANGQPYKSSGGKMVYNETLKREIPEGWGVDSLAGLIASDKSGDWGKESAQGNYTEQVFCMRGADLNGLNGKGSLKPPTRFILKKNCHKLLKQNDFIVEISGGSPVQSTGRLAFICDDVLSRFDSPVICSNFCRAFSLSNPELVFYFSNLWSSIYDHKILFGWEGKTSGIKNLLFDSFINAYWAVVPDPEVLSNFNALAAPIQAKKQKLLFENQQLTSLRDFLLPMLMNGQVQVVGDVE